MALTKVSYSMIQGTPANVLDYGADPSGVADSSAAFTAALAENQAIYIPIGVYIVNDVTVPSNKTIIGEAATNSLIESTVLKTTINDAPIFSIDEGDGYIHMSNIVAITTAARTSFIKQNGNNLDNIQWCNWSNIWTSGNFEVSFDGFFILCNWYDCVDGYIDNGTTNHAFIRSMPNDATNPSVSQSNVCSVVQCRAYFSDGTIPNRSGSSTTSGSGIFLLGFANGWMFDNLVLENHDVPPFLLRGCRVTEVRNTWFESIDASSIFKVENLTVSGGATFTSFPLRISSCNFNLAQTSGYVVNLASDTTPIPSGNAQNFFDRVTFSDCQFSAGGATTVSNIPNQCRYTNCRFPENNDDYMVTFFAGGRQTPSADQYGNSLADATTAAYFKARRVGLGSYGDSAIGGLECWDYTNNKNVAQIIGEGKNSGANGNLYFGVIQSSTVNNLMQLTYSNTFEPITDNSMSLGTGSKRMSVIYAATGTINTSDERAKQVRDDGIDEKVLKAWGKVKYQQFKFNDAIEKKGDGARWHFGLIAQKVKEAFESEGLDAFAYGLLCYDKWDDELKTIVDENGNTTEEKRIVTYAGDRYGIRYEEALALECAYLRSLVEKLAFK